jgi:hypothetical protein
MVKSIEGYWMSIVAPGFFVQRFTLGPLPPGTNLYASISLSDVNTLFAANQPDPKFATTAFVESWTFYKPDGTESGLQVGRRPASTCGQHDDACFGQSRRTKAQRHEETLRTFAKRQETSD